MKIHIYSMFSVHRCCQQMSAVPEKRHARLELPMWNRLSTWPRLSGVKRAAVPAWHINLYGQVTPERWSQALPSHRAPSLQDSSTFFLLVFLHTFHEIMTQKCFPTGFTLDKRRDWQGFQTCFTLFLNSPVWHFK